MEYFQLLDGQEGVLRELDARIQCVGGGGTRAPGAASV